MRPLRRELTADGHAEALRSSQLAHLASSALAPLVADYERDILDRLVSFVRTRSVTPHEHVWAALGELAACRELHNRLESRKKLNPLPPHPET